MKSISVLMGVFNCAETLGEAIDSILEQTYTEWKLIMCDDGSTDDTYGIALRYAEEYPDKIVVLKNEKNMGLNYTLNRCLSVADGELIARMDGDDVSLPNRFEKEVEFLNTHPEYSIVSSPMIYFDEDGEFKTGQGKGEPKIRDFAKGTQFCHAPCMVRHEAYDEVNGYSTEKRYLRVEDWHLWIKMYEKGYRGYNLTEPLYKMRDDRNAFCRRRFMYRINEARLTLEAIRRLRLPIWCSIYSIKPILIGLLPSKLYMYLHKKVW